MKKLLLILVLVVSMAFTGFTQEINVYTFFVNIVNENFRFPLIGFVNIANGEHSLPQFGFINWNTRNFSTLQAGFINTVGCNMSGVQLGFVNTSVGDVNGLQSGFINTTKGLSGAQIGFINTAINGGRGFQLGFVNTSVQKLQGVQIGFINYADSIEDGIPIGFISIIRNGGYKAIEYSFSEFYPINIGLKLGVEKFYSTIIAAYNPIEGYSQESFATGLGFGSIIPINASFFINPELNWLNTTGKNNRQILSFVPNFGFNVNKKISVTMGPSVTWSYNFSGDGLKEPFFSIFNYNINEKNSIVIGARASIRFGF
jgi:hypothetical protein